jgi:flagellin
LFSGTDGTASGLTITTDGKGGTFQMTAVNLGASAYTTATNSSISSTTAAATALTNVTAAITALATDRANVGANEETLTYTGDELGVLADNLTAASSNLTDVDVATESTKYAAYQILVQSGTSMLAQANQNPQSVLKLLQ